MSRILVQSILDGAIAQNLTLYYAASFGGFNGRASVDFLSSNIDSNFYFDLASLTKILSTTLLTAQAILENRISLEERPWHNSNNQNWKDIKIKNILWHNSGLPAWREIKILENLYEQKLAYKTGAQTVYSDLGFMALGDLLEKRFNKSLDELFKTYCQNYFETDQIFYSKELGVNDQNCQNLGNIAGHAGLFGSLEGVKKACDFFLDNINLENSKNKNKKLYRILKYFASTRNPRPLGFDYAQKNGSTGDALSQNTVGHLGYTGVSTWIDAEHQRYYILLANRCHFKNHKVPPLKLLKLRQDFHQAACSLSRFQRGAGV